MSLKWGPLYVKFTVEFTILLKVPVNLQLPTIFVRLDSNKYPNKNPNKDPDKKQNTK